jgi:hypothetical protein
MPDANPRSLLDSLRDPRAIRQQLDPQLSDEHLVAFTLIHTWTLMTGRVLRPGTTPCDLSVDDLIDFWADPRTDLDSEGGW